MRARPLERTLRSMKRNLRLRNLLATAAVAATTIAAAPLADVAHARPNGPDVPDRIQVEDGHSVYLVGHAVGVQIYSCASSAGGTRWTFVGPRADVFGENGQLVMTHFAGPTWQGRDGSTVVGSRVDGVTVDPTAIPWLLLSVASTAPGPTGRRAPGGDHVHPADQHDGRAGAARGGLHRSDRRHDERSPIHRRLLLLEGARALRIRVRPRARRCRGCSCRPRGPGSPG